MTTPHVQPITNPALAGGGLSPLATMSAPILTTTPRPSTPSLSRPYYQCPKVVVD